MYTIERYTIPEIIEKSSRRYAERPSLAMVGGEPLLYAELEPRTRRVAALLGLLGVRKGSRVAILSENRPEWGLAYLGASRSGAVAVPIMTDFSAEQVANILEHSECRIVLASGRFLGKIEAEGARRTLVSIEDFSVAAPGPLGAPIPSDAEVERAERAFEEPWIEADDLASILYTSGTMGRSKGVMLTHRNLVYDAWAATVFLRLHRTDRLLSILPLAHAYEFTIGFLIPLMHGSAIYYLDRPPSASALMPALASVRPTIMLTVPLVIEKVYRSSVQPALEKMSLYKVEAFRPALEYLAGLRLKRSFGGALRFFGIGGAPLAADVEDFLHAARFPYSIGYGLTETAPLLAGNRGGEVVPHTTGVPAEGVELRIGDRRPDTGEGEIQARGPNVFLGYYKDPAMSAEAFTQDGWYRTGDLGVMDAEGRITVRGRLKTMILGSSGENIYPEEIEAVLNSSPYVLESLVYSDHRGLTALVHLRPEAALEYAAARVRDGIEEAEVAAERLERSAAVLLEHIRHEANCRLAAFSRLARVELQVEPFEKTPKQSIKRFLYPRKRG